MLLLAHEYAHCSSWFKGPQHNDHPKAFGVDYATAWRALTEPAIDYVD
jgi:hypothetical protein